MMKSLFAKRYRNILTLALALALLLGCAAFAQEVVPVQYSSTGDIAMDADGALWFPMDGALMRLDPDGSCERVAEGDVHSVQCDGSAVYYVLREAVPDDPYEEKAIETLWRVGEDGRAEQIGGERPSWTEREYGGEDLAVSSGVTYAGYTDLRVYEGRLYYIGTDDVAGSYVTDATNWDAGMVETAYPGGCAVYCMDPESGEETKLISGLGNGLARMDVADDRIAVASCFMNPVYAYDFCNFMLYDLEGNHVKTFPNLSESRHSWIFKEDCEFTEIVLGVRTDGEKILASLGDSEGDFASSRLADVENIGENICIEAFYAPSLSTADGLYYVTADVEDTFWVEGMEYTTQLRFRAADGTETLLAHIPHNYIGFDMDLLRAGDELYCLSRRISFGNDEGKPGVLLRVDLESGAVDELGEAGFAVSVACDPEYYTPPVLAWNMSDGESGEDYIEGSFLLPDSDIYAYSAEELEMYDAETLALMRNEILARHGYVFQKEVYREYFSSQSWYEPDPDFSYDRLNAVEMENVELIKKLEAR